MKLKKTSLATALVAALAMGAAGQASASVYASSQLLVENFVIQVTNLAGPALQNYSFTSESSASLNGVSTLDTKTCGTLGSAPACAAGSPILQSVASLGAPARPAGDFSFSGPGVGNTYSNAAGEITDAGVVTGNPSVIKMIAETEIAGSGVGTGQSTLSSDTRFVFNFTIAAGGLGDLFLSFKANPSLFVAVDTLNLLGASATAGISTSFNLVSTATNTNVSWTPNGRRFGPVTGDPSDDFESCLGVVSCVELLDEETLNTTRTLGAGNPASNGFSDPRYLAGSGAMSDFAIRVNGLAPGDYTIALVGTNFVRAEQTVPEPGTLMLIGGALAALGVGGLRRRREDKASA